MTEFTIGRDPDCQIHINHPTVSRWQAKIAPLGDDTFNLSDTESSGGSYVRVKAGWRSISSATVRLDDQVRFGEYVTTVAELLRRASPMQAKGKIKMVRNSFGEIVRTIK